MCVHVVMCAVMSCVSHVMRVHVVMHESGLVQGAEYAWDALSRRSLSAKEPLIVGLFSPHEVMSCVSHVMRRGGGLGSSTIFKKFNEPYAPS